MRSSLAGMFRVFVLNYEANNKPLTGSPAGQILYYLWNVATALVLINVLISLFSSAYSDVSHALLVQNVFCRMSI